METLIAHLQPFSTTYPSPHPTHQIDLAFPISNVRALPYTPLPPSETPQPPSKPTCLQESPCPSKPYVQTSLGLWSNGVHEIMSATHPQVSDFLARATLDYALPPSPSDTVHALAALEVFYKPGDPVHWLFWSDTYKSDTADLITHITLSQPPKIKSPIAWNGTREYLSILSNLHAPTHRHLFENKPWYHLLVPEKLPTPARVPNLRNRRLAQTAALVDLDVEEDQVEDGTADEGVDSRTNASSSAGLSTRTKRFSKKSRMPDNVADEGGEDALIGLATAAASISVLADDDGDDAQSVQAGPKEASRTRDRKGKGRRKESTKRARKATSVVSGSLRSSSPVSVLVVPTPLLPEDVPEPLASAPTDTVKGRDGLGSHSRNRSTSQDSVETLVASSRSRADSVDSAETAVEPKKGGSKRKRGIDSEDEGEGDGLASKRKVVSDGEEDEDQPRRRQTRAQTRADSVTKNNSERGTPVGDAMVETITTIAKVQRPAAQGRRKQAKRRR